MSLQVQSTNDAAAYLKRAGDFLCTHAVEHSVLLTSAHLSIAEPSGKALWLWAERDGRVVAAAQHQPPRQAYVSLVPDDVMLSLAHAMYDQRPDVPGVGGMRRDAEAFGREWRAVAGTRITATMAQGIYVADLVRPPPGVPGQLRVAGPADRDLVQAWSDDFRDEIESEHVPRVDVRPRIDQGLVFVWDDSGAPVSLTAVSPAYGGVVRVSLVYTPPALRGRGYAAACVAAVTARSLARGHGCMLYTDLANPTSNGVYQRVGYHRVGEAVELRFS